jgi:hypothetical protein
MPQVGDPNNSVSSNIDPGTFSVIMGIYETIGADGKISVLFSQELDRGAALGTCLRAFYSITIRWDGWLER